MSWTPVKVTVVTVRGVCLAVVIGCFAALAVQAQHADTTAVAAAPPCNNYLSEVTPPENIGVAITNASGNVVGVSYVDFKTYVKDVLPNEWLPNWQQAAYQAGAMTVKTYGWYFVNHWDGDVYVPTGQCWHVRDDVFDQVYIAGSSTVPTAYAVEQTWNWHLHRNGAIYPTYYKAGCPVNIQGYPPCNGATDGCGYFMLDRQADMNDPDDGNEMSQYGSQACAAAPGPYQYSWAQIIAAYYFNNFAVPGDHGYGQGHAAMGWGPAPWTPVSVSSIGGGSVWKFRASNSCGPPFTSFGYGVASAIKVVGDWDGAYNPDGHTQGVVQLVNGALIWSLSNYRQPSSPSYQFSYGAYGDIPIVGDWDGNGTWTPGVYRGGNWLLRNYNSPGPPSISFGWGTGNDTPVPGKWLATSGNQPTTPGVVRFDPVGGGLKWLLRYANAPGGVDNEFGWGPYWGRPITGDWWTGDGLTQFGPGFVTDVPPDNPCTSPTPTQEWTLKYIPSAGGVDAQFRYELNRP